VVGSVLRANTDGLDVSEATLKQGEILDMESFGALRELIIPSLGQAVVPDDTILHYMEAVFWSSMLYRVPGMPAGTQEWLTAREHGGSTSELVIERRSRMAYVCIDELFSLTAVSSGSGKNDSAELKRLAEMAAPWLIRRVGLVLSRYVSDQPLRGRMPQPASQRKEMLYILDQVVRLDSALETVHIDSPHIPPSSKRHLFKLFPLFTQCIAVAQGDAELLGLLSRALGEVGDSLKLNHVL